MSDVLASMLLAIADDELVIGHRHSEWTGFAPHIEEDVAFSSIAQDEIGHAAAFYSLAAQELGRDANALAFGRQPGEYRHAIVCERPNRDWAYTLARHWLYDHADEVRLASLEETKHEGLAALAAKVRREERYHLLHADNWIKRIANGPLDGRRKLVDAVGEAFPAMGGFFEPYENEEEALSQGLLNASSAELWERFERAVRDALDRLGLPTTLPQRQDARAEFVASSSGDLIASEDGDAGGVGPAQDAGGGRRGRHTADFEALWDEMTSTYRNDPGATW